jgi:hypothetical protein
MLVCHFDGKTKSKNVIYIIKRGNTNFYKVSWRERSAYNFDALVAVLFIRKV